jgi:DNA-binding NtrC family response regulator
MVRELNMPFAVELDRTRYALNFHRAKTRFEKDFFTYVLRMFDGNVSRAADAIGMARRNLQIKIQHYNINVERMRK